MEKNYFNLTKKEIDFLINFLEKNLEMDPEPKEIPINCLEFLLATVWLEKAHNGLDKNETIELLKTL